MEKNNRLSLRCSASFKNDVLTAAKKMNLDMSSFISYAVYQTINYLGLKSSSAYKQYKQKQINLDQEFAPEEMEEIMEVIKTPWVK